MPLYVVKKLVSGWPTPSVVIICVKTLLPSIPSQFMVSYGTLLNSDLVVHAELFFEKAFSEQELAHEGLS